MKVLFFALSSLITFIVKTDYQVSMPNNWQNKWCRNVQIHLSQILVVTKNCRENYHETEKNKHHSHDWYALNRFDKDLFRTSAYDHVSLARLVHYTDERKNYFSFWKPEGKNRSQTNLMITGSINGWV